MRDSTIRQICNNALIAAIYVALTIVPGVNLISFGQVQFRVAEILVLLCFFRKDYSIGLIIGCAIANAIGATQSGMALDFIFGTIATALSVLCIAFSKNLFLASLFPVIINGFVIGAELYFYFELPFWINVGFVALGEFVVITIFGVLLFSYLRKNKLFLKIINANQNIEEE